MPYIIIPFDFIRIFSVFTIIDFLSIFVFFVLSVQGKVKFPFNYIACFFMVLIAYVLLAGIFSKISLFENVKLSIVFLFIMLKVYLIFHYIRTVGLNSFLIKTSYGFLLLNVILLSTYIAGIGLSGSGRFGGLFGGTNGLAAYSLIALVLGLYMFLNSKISSGLLSFLVVITSFFLGLSTLSKGFFVYLIMITVFWFVFCKFKNAFSRTMALFLIVLLSYIFIEFISHNLIYLLNVISGLSGLNFDRIIDFLYTFNDIGLNADLDETRSELNSIIFNQYLSDMRFFGYGYDSSVLYTGGLRAHNIILTGLFELGFLFFLFICFYFIFVLYQLFVLRRSSSIEWLLAFWGLVVLLLSMKTPFYFIYAFPWFVFLALFLKKTGVIKIET